MFQLLSEQTITVIVSSDAGGTQRYTDQRAHPLPAKELKQNPVFCRCSRD
jgi:hypothetical protein